MTKQSWKTWLIGIFMKNVLIVFIFGLHDCIIIIFARISIKKMLEVGLENFTVVSLASKLRNYWNFTGKMVKGNAMQCPLG